MNRRHRALVPALIRVVGPLLRAPRSAMLPGVLPGVLLGGLLLGAALLGGCAGSSASRTAPGSTTGAAQDLSGPVRMRHVALFSSGVAYFEQGGTVPEGGVSTLSFTTGELDDALKSLILEDSSGRIASIEYPSTLPLQHLLRDSTVDLSGQPSLAALLDQLRGTRLSLVWHGATLEGTILNVEVHSEVGITGATTIRHETLSLLQDGRSRQVPLTEIEQVRFLDAPVQDSLAHALMTIRSARSDQRRTVSVHTSADGPQQVRIGYVTAAPMWKSSYRLVLAPDAAAPAHLQGWAIVENQSDEDWLHVALSLVSGRPQSFIERLSQPLLVQRPQVDPVIYASLRPQSHAGAERQAQLLSAADRNGLGPTAGMMRRAGGRKRGAALAKHFQFSGEPMDLTRSIAVALHSDTLADRTSYTLDDISIPHDRSALLPFVNQAIRAEDISIYTSAAGLTHPLRGVLLTNTSAANLGQGPVAVFDQGGWLGDAQLPDLPAHDHRLLSYAIDLPITVRIEAQDPVARTTAWSLAGGVLSVTQQITSTAIYRIDHATSGPRTLILEIPRVVGWTLSDMPPAFEQTPEVTRFRIVLDGRSQSTSFTVHGRCVGYQQFTLSRLDAAAMLDLETTGHLPQALLGLLDQIARLRRDIADGEHRQATVVAGLSAYAADQQRVRHILPVLATDRPLAQRLDRRLSADETEIEIRQAALRALTSEREMLQKRLDHLLNTVGAALEAQ